MHKNTAFTLLLGSFLSFHFIPLNTLPFQSSTPCVKNFLLELISIKSLVSHTKELVFVMFIDTENYKPSKISFFSFICQKAQSQTYSSIMETKLGPHIHILFHPKFFIHISLFYRFLYASSTLAKSRKEYIDDTWIANQVER